MSRAVLTAADPGPHEARALTPPRREFGVSVGAVRAAVDDLYVVGQFEDMVIDDAERVLGVRLPPSLVVVLNADGVEFACLDTQAVGRDGEARCAITPMHRVVRVTEDDTHCEWTGCPDSCAALRFGPQSDRAIG